MLYRKFNSFLITYLFISSCSASIKEITRNITLAEEAEPGKELFTLATIVGINRGKFETISERVIDDKFMPRKISSEEFPFMVGKDTGIFTTSKRIDRELFCEASNKCLIQAKVLVSSPQRYLVTINVNIEDVNDNTPVFPVNELRLNVSENRRIQDPINLDAYQAIDKDKRDNAKLRYGIRPTSNPYFQIISYFDENDLSHLQLQLKKMLDYELDKVIEFTIEATDNGRPRRRGTIRVVVNVIDENDHRPNFHEKHYVRVITEGSPVGKEILRTEATDKDSGNYGKVRYFLSARNSRDVRESFRMNEKTGSIFLKKTLDRESISKIRIIIEARDSDPMNPKTGTALLEIELEDVNDNKPSLDIDIIVPSKNGKAFLSESSASGQYLAHISLNDDDIGLNGKVDVNVTTTSDCDTFDDPGEPFRVTSEGFLESMVTFDRERCAAYTVHLQACDNGSPRLCNVNKQEVVILDENEYSPEILESTITTNVSEDAEIGHVVANVTAYDKDSNNTPALTKDEDDNIFTSKNGYVTYSIVDGDDGHFSIGKRSGKIQIVSKLDREEKKEWNLRISAKDGGSPPKEAFANVTVHVKDVNDNRPCFIDPSENEHTYYAYKSMVDPVTYIKAEDRDEGANAEIVYSLTYIRTTEYQAAKNNRNSSKLFILNSKSGELRLNRSLRNTSIAIGRHKLEVQARDKGSPSFQSVVEFYVEVCENEDGISGLRNPDTTKTSVFRDPNFISVLVSSITLLLAVFVILALVRFRQIRNTRASASKQQDISESQELKQMNNYQDNSVPCDIFKPDSCQSVADEPQDNDDAKENPAAKEQIKPLTVSLQQSDSDSGRGDSDLDGTCALQNDTKGASLTDVDSKPRNILTGCYLAEATGTKQAVSRCGEECRRYGHGDSCWMPEEGTATKVINEAATKRPVTYCETNNFQQVLHYQRPGIEHRLQPLTRAGTFTYGAYPAHAVNLNTADVLSLPRRPPYFDRPHSNPCLLNMGSQSSTSDLMRDLNSPSPCQSAPQSPHSSSPALKSFSVRSEKACKSLRPHLETVYETENILSKNTKNQNRAPRLIRQDAFIPRSSYPRSLTEPNSARRVHGSMDINSAKLTSFPRVSLAATMRSDVRYGLQDVDCAVENFDLML